MELSLNADLELRQQDELDSIASIYGDIFTDITSKELVWNKKPCPHFQIALKSQEDLDRPELSVTLDIEFTKTYPLSAPIVKLLNPRNLLKSRVAELETRIKELIHEYPNQEVSFTIISEIKFMLDEFQLKTDKNLSLEEERERRLRSEREKLEKEEQLKEHELMLQQEVEDRELNEQIQKIQDEYIDSDSETDITDVTDTEISLPDDKHDFFIFDNPITDTVAHLRGFRFKAVNLCEKYVGKDLFSSISEQWIVEPYLHPDIRKKMQDKSITLKYLLTEITLTGSFWLKEDGKREIQTLEKELQQSMDVAHPNIARLYGFQMDKMKNSWRIYLLTEFCPSAVNMEAKLALEPSVDWAVARSWLIQILPAIEYIHNLGIVHKFICPLTLYLFNPDDSDYSSEQRKVMKLFYPAYGHRLMSLFYNQSNKTPKVHSENSFLYIGMPKDWISPEVQKASKGHQRKTDVWDLGVLFTRFMFGPAIFEKYRTPLEFTSDFDPTSYPKYKEYAEDVYDLLSRMLQTKLSKRPTPLELNAFKFLRDGPVIAQRDAREMLESSSEDRVINENHMYANDKAKIGRYERDFEEIGRLGKGGFGEVVKARNRMEGTYYAIKKIKHKSNKLDSLLKEVLSLARLNHQYIVRYYGTWVEDAPEDEQDSNTTGATDTFETEEGFESPINRPVSSFASSHDNSFQVDFISNSFDPNISFAPISEEEDDNFEFGSYNNETEESQATIESVKKRATPKNNNRLAILYIQMEFCENNTLENLIEQGLPKNSNEYWRLFRQLLEAVSYIHREGFIHRDLKPTNIFIDKSNNIKVGDFGLAKNSQFSSAIATNNQVASRDRDLSTVVGTFFYTAKEVASGSYDEKVDMYSLGIMFFEMCFELKTGMERAHTLNDLRLASIKFPADFNDTKYKLERRIITSLLEHDPKKRPSAGELLQSGWMPVEHQDQIIKEALKSLADPASPWQQQVRETLFNQSYSLARDLMFDSGSRNTHKQHLDYSIKDHLVFNNMITQLFHIFRKHGAIEAFNTDMLIPRSPIYNREATYDILDKSGAVLSLPYDLILPFARFLSRNRVTIPKLFRHDFVYRPNLRGPGTPDKFGVVSFDVVRADNQYSTFNDAECIKVIDEVLESFPCFQIKGSTCAIIINHYDILDAIIAFTFGNVGIEEKSKYEIMGILSQLGIDGGPEEIKRYLREDYKVPTTVTNDLIDLFNFTVDPEKAKAKLQKIFIDSPLLIRVERAIAYINNVLSIVKSFGVRTTIYFNPLINYNSRYYSRGLMFQAVYKVDKNRKYSRIATGGRYDSFIASLSNTGMSNFTRNFAVGFSLSTTYLFLMLKNFEKQKPSLNRQSWKKARCDVLVTSLSKDLLAECGHEILKALWESDISADIFLSTSQDDFIDKARNEGVNWIIVIRASTKGKARKSNGKYKSIRVRDMRRNKDTDVDSEEVVNFIKREVRDRNFELENEKNPIKESSTELPADELVLGQSQLFSVDINPKTVVVANEAPRGRKIKRDKWEVENDSIIATANVVKSIASSTVISADVSDEVLEAISAASIAQQELWLRKVFAAGNNVPKSFALNILNALNKEASKGVRWVVLYSSKTNNTKIVDLQR